MCAALRLGPARTRVIAVGPVAEFKKPTNTGRLLPLIQRTPGARVVVVASTAQRAGKIDFDDLNWERRPYRPWAAYGQSKLANMMFALELQRRLAASGSPVRATAAHPGWTATDLQRTTAWVRLLNPLFAMKPAGGAMPTLRAATDPAALGGTYWGPKGLFEVSGPPVPARIPKPAQDEAVAARLWQISETLTGVAFPLAAPTARRTAA